MEKREGKSGKNKNVGVYNSKLRGEEAEEKGLCAGEKLRILVRGVNRFRFGWKK